MPIEITMPALSPTMQSGKIIAWLKKAGEVVLPGDVISEIETDKAIMELDVPYKGRMGRIIVPEGTENVQVGTVIGVLLSENEKEADIDTFLQKFANATNSNESKDNVVHKQESKNITVEEEGTSHDVRQGKVLFASPLAKKLAQLNNVDLTQIQNGSGPAGRIIKADIEHYIKNIAIGSEKKSVARNFKTSTLKPLTGMRKTIAKRLTESKQNVPHFYLKIDIVMDKLLEVREIINKKYIQDTNQKVSINDIFIKAIGNALAKHSVINASWSENGLLQYNNVDVAFAVSIEEGLITPIVQNADQKSIFEIAKETKNLIQKAKNNKLTPEEYTGGSITISNMGMMGVAEFGAIINTPQSCIVAVGATQKKAIVDEKDEIVIKQICTITLSGDHRVIDGSDLAKFANTIKENLEDVILLLL